jgi:hypothetical protein
VHSTTHRRHTAWALNYVHARIDAVLS